MALMNRMRSSMKTILLILVVAFVLTIIVDWGMGGFQSNQPRGIIGEVDGNQIHYEEYYNRYQNELVAYREQAGSEPEGYQLQQLETRVFDNLVQQRLLDRVVSQVNLKASDREIVEEIFNNPPMELRQNQAFQDSTGQFDMRAYQAALNNPGAGEFWASVEDYLRLTLPMRKLDNLLRVTAVVSDEEVRIEYMKRNLKARVEYVLVPATEFTASVPPPSDDEIKAYHHKHEKEFKEPEKRVIDYVSLDFKPTRTDSVAVEQLAGELLRDARSGQDFADLARIHSQDPGSAQNGGDLGYFARGAMVKPFEDAAFAGRVGDIVGPVISQFGIHIIKVIDQKKEDGQDKVQASHILLKYEMSPRTREALQDEANYIAETAKEQSLKSVAASENVEIKHSEPFATGGYIPGLGMESRINNWVFRNSKGAISDVFYTERGYVIVQIAEVIDEHIKPWSEVKDQIASKLKNEKALLQAREKCQKIADQARSSGSLESAAAAAGLKVQQSDQLGFNSYLASIGREPRFAGVAFGLPVGTISSPIEGSRGYYVLKVLERTPMNESDFEGQKESLRSQLTQRKQQGVFTQWYTALKEKANIKDHRKDYF